MNNSLYGVELVKAGIEHKETITVRFFILHYAKQRMLELYYNFLAGFCGANKFEELEMDTDSLYLGLGKKELEECIRPGMKTKWERFRSKNCSDSFFADSCGNINPRVCHDKRKKHDRGEPGLFKEEFRCTEILCLCSKTYCCYMLPRTSVNSAAKV